MTCYIFTARKGQPDFGSEYNRARFIDDLKKHEGKDYRIERIKYTRSLDQNRLYWFYLGIIEKETGNNANDLHEYLKRALLPPRSLKVLGKTIQVPSSTTELSKLAMGDYMEKIAALVNVPIPDTKTYQQYLESAPLKNN
jgi:hypothetical protein